MAFKRGSIIIDVILVPLYNTSSLPHSGGSIVKVISLNNDEEPIHKVFYKIVMKYITSPFVPCLFYFKVIEHAILQ